MLAVLAPGLPEPALASAGNITVYNTSDSGPGSLRQAILDANGRPGLDVITFAIGSGAQTISLHSPLPAVSDQVEIDGRTQPGFTGSPIVELDGSGAGGGPGLLITAGHSTVRGLVINRFAGNGIDLANVGDDVVEGNFIGTDITGTAPMGNTGNGVVVNAATLNNRIGGTSPGSRNVISASGDKGIVLVGGSSGAVVQGNFIGTDVTGSIALANHFFGVSLETSNGNLIGGATAEAGNLISGNGVSGVNIFNGSNGNVVQGNLIGTNRAGSAGVGNGTWGVVIDSAPNNTIGGTSPQARNVISGNQRDGILLAGPASSGNVVQGNFVGTDAGGDKPLPNVGNGVTLDRAGHNTIGGSSAGARNIISANGDKGVAIFGGSGANAVKGNYIGTDVSGTAALGNGFYGVFIGSPSNLIGGASAGAGNVIAASGANGINIVGSGADHNVVQGNLIGTDASGKVALGNGGLGVFVIDATDNLIGGTTPAARNVISANGNDGVGIVGTSSTRNLVQGNYVGTDSSGTLAIGNALNGVTIGNVSGNTVGGTQPGAGNVISGNLNSGVLIYGAGATANLVQDNLLGTDSIGTSQLSNHWWGVALDGAPRNMVGGATPAARNVISGNGFDGILIVNASASGNLVRGNFIGTDAGGTNPIPNSGNGVAIDGGASQNTIGGTDGGAGNVIAYNTLNGVVVRSGTGDAILGNSIFSNGGLGIDLGGYGVTPNDRGDVDSGPNNFQNFPVLRRAVATRHHLVVVGSVDTPNPQTVTIEIYANSVPAPGADPSGHGEGQAVIGTVTPNRAGRFTVILPPQPKGTVITATATDSAGNTSEFAFDVVAGP